MIAQATHSILQRAQLASMDFSVGTRYLVKLSIGQVRGNGYAKAD